MGGGCRVGAVAPLAAPGGGSLGNGGSPAAGVPVRAALGPPRIASVCVSPPAVCMLGGAAAALKMQITPLPALGAAAVRPMKSGNRWLR